MPGHTHILNLSLKLTEKLPKGAIILDMGSGRGFFKTFSKLGFRVIGIDFEKIIKKANENIKDWALEEN
jgi:2-polyprenyl-3-methyl-5-hydroxy-6-metoxy-1,4-benzoquinol methylase